MSRLLLLCIFTFYGMAGMSQSITVMSYNIRLDTESDGINQWKNRITKVGDLIKKYNPDLLGVQEALPNQVRDLQNILSEYAFVGVGREDGEEKGEYSAIYFKKNQFELMNQSTFWLSTTPQVPGSKSWDAAITRIVTWALLKEKSSGKEFFYANTHFDHVGKEAREQSAHIIKSYITGFRYGIGRELPVIITGDFNSEPTEPAYKTMINGQEVKLVDSRPADNNTGTFCGFEVNKIECRTIDFIFHSTHWRASHYQVIQDHDGKFYPSDHLPVLTTLTVK